MKLRIETEYPRDGVALVTLSGDLDVYTGPHLKETVTVLLERGLSRLIIDLTPLDGVDSTGLGVLLSAMRRATELGGELRIVCGTPRNRRIFEITGLTKVFSLDATREEALGAGAPGPEPPRAP